MPSCYREGDPLAIWVDPEALGVGYVQVRVHNLAGRTTLCRNLPEFVDRLRVWAGDGLSVQREQHGLAVRRPRRLSEKAGGLLVPAQQFDGLAALGGDQEDLLEPSLRLLLCSLIGADGDEFSVRRNR